MRTLEDQISSNKAKSIFLLLIVPMILVAIVFVIGYAWGNAFGGIFLGTIISVLYTLGMYYAGDKLVLSATGAREASKANYPMFHNLVEGLCIASGLPEPKLYVQQSLDINAFATGRDPAHAIVCVTTGSLEHLNRTELEGVLAHELSHVKNYDMRFMTIVVALVGAISIISQIFIRSLWYGGGDRREGGNAIFMIIGLALAILAPIAAMLTQLAISRRREFLADASGAHMTRYPEGLASALEKIEKYNQGRMQVSKAVASLYISNPFGADRIAGLFSTHPPLKERIKRLRVM